MTSARWVSLAMTRFVDAYAVIPTLFSGLESGERSGRRDLACVTVRLTRMTARHQVNDSDSGRSAGLFIVRPGPGQLTTTWAALDFSWPVSMGGVWETSPAPAASRYEYGSRTVRVLSLYFFFQGPGGLLGSFPVLVNLMRSRAFSIYIPQKCLFPFPEWRIIGSSPFGHHQSALPPLPLVPSFLRLPGISHRDEGNFGHSWTRR